jgi:predicted dehydrogenase
MKQARLTRRDFLKAAGALAAAPYVITSGALGAGDQPPASERIVCGHIGMGAQGGSLLGGFLGNPNAQSAAVCDPDKWRRDNAKQRADQRYGTRTDGPQGGVMAYNDFRDLIARADIDAVVMAVPDHWHALISVAAMQAGKDVYCEKPLALTIKQGREMVNAARRYGRVFQTGTMQRSMPGFRQTCEIALNARIGKVHTVFWGAGGSSSDVFLPAEPMPEGIDWELYIGPAPWRPYNKRYHQAGGIFGFGQWHGCRDFCGGSLTDGCAHGADIINWGVTADQSDPVEVYPPGETYPTLTWKYANGVLVHGWSPEYGIPKGHNGQLKAGGFGGLFVGDKGWVEVNRGYFKCYPESVAYETPGPKDIRLYVSTNHGQNFLDCIKTRGRPVSDVLTGHRAAVLNHLGNIAVWTGRAIKWDPVKEEILGDPEAARWLSRPMRAPWRL